MAARIAWAATAVAALVLPRLPAVEAIVGLRTDVAGSVGMATRGAIDPTVVESLADFVRAFGGADPSLSSPWLAPAIAAFFEKAAGGRERRFSFEWTGRR